MTLSHQKRNPFKKSLSSSSSKINSNPLKHLFDNVVGIENAENELLVDGAKVINESSEDLFDSENTENIDVNLSEQLKKV